MPPCDGVVCRVPQALNDGRVGSSARRRVLQAAADDDLAAMLYNRTYYYELQCSTAYEGTLCGRCKEGYGRKGEAECGK